MLVFHPTCTENCGEAGFVADHETFVANKSSEKKVNQSDFGLVFESEPDLEPAEMSSIDAKPKSKGESKFFEASAKGNDGELVCP